MAHEIREDRAAISAIDAGVPLYSPEVNEKISENSGSECNSSAAQSSEVKIEKLEENGDAISTLSKQRSKVNFGFLPVPKNCRVSPTKPYKLNLATNMLFGFASTFTVTLALFPTEDRLPICIIINPS